MKGKVREVKEWGWVINIKIEMRLEEDKGLRFKSWMLLKGY